MRNACSHSFRKRKDCSLCLSALSTLNSILSKCKPLFMQFCFMHLDTSLHHLPFREKEGEDDYINSFVSTSGLHTIQLFQDVVVYTCSDAEVPAYRAREFPTNPSHWKIVSLAGFVYQTLFMLGSINIIFLYKTTHRHYVS